MDEFTNLGSVAVSALVGGWNTIAFLGTERRGSLENLSSSKTIRAGGFGGGICRSPVQHGELVKRWNPLDLGGMLFFAMGVKSVRLAHMLPSFRRLRTAGVASTARVCTIFVL